MPLRLFKYLLPFAAFTAIFISSCSVDNKTIPDPDGGIIVDTTGTLGTFIFNVSGDTSYQLTVVAVDTLVQDSLLVAGADVTIRDQIVFSTAKAEPGTYYTEQAPPGITGGAFLFRKRLATGFRNYPMLHGKIIINSVNTSSGVVTGSIDVNNEWVTTADHLYRIRGNFTININD